MFKPTAFMMEQSLATNNVWPLTDLAVWLGSMGQTTVTTRSMLTQRQAATWAGVQEDSGSKQQQL